MTRASVSRLSEQLRREPLRRPACPHRPRLRRLVPQRPRRRLTSLATREIPLVQEIWGSQEIRVSQAPLAMGPLPLAPPTHLARRALAQLGRWILGRWILKRWARQA